MGYIAALFIGISLGLIGGGGSILTVPVFVYLFGVSPVLATSYSLFVVGSTSLIGSVSSYKKGLVELRVVLLFGITSIATVFTIRKLVIPVIPEIIKVGGYSFHFSVITMILFAVLMILAAVSMIRSHALIVQISSPKKSTGLLLIYGMVIGLVTGFLGAGGGFLLIPVLVLMVHLPMKKSIGTSLLIIALNSLIGFAGDAGHFHINWSLLLAVSAIAIGGILIGGLLSKKIEGEKLKKGFGVFVLLMGVYIIIREFF